MDLSFSYLFLPCIVIIIGFDFQLRPFLEFGVIEFDWLPFHVYLIFFHLLFCIARPGFSTLLVHDAQQKCQNIGCISVSVLVVNISEDTGIYFWFSFSFTSCYFIVVKDHTCNHHFVICIYVYTSIWFGVHDEFFLTVSCNEEIYLIYNRVLSQCSIMSGEGIHWCQPYFFGESLCLKRVFVIQRSFLLMSQDRAVYLPLFIMCNAAVWVFISLGFFPFLALKSAVKNRKFRFGSLLIGASCWL